MKSLGILVLASALSLSAVQAAEFAVGDWAEYEVTIRRSGLEAKHTLRLEIVAQDDSSITIQSTVTYAGQSPQTNQSKVSLENLKKIDNQDNSKDIEQGSETLTLAGREYDCQWTQTIADLAPHGEVTTKTWRSPEVPVFQKVREESSTAQMTIHTDLVDSGRKS